MSPTHPNPAASQAKRPAKVTVALVQMSCEASQAANVAKAESGLLFFLASSPMLGLRKAVRMSLLVSADASVALNADGRTILPYSIPGRFMSDVY